MPYDQTMRADVKKAIKSNTKKKKPKRGQRAKKSASNQGGASIGGGTS